MGAADSAISVKLVVGSLHVDLKKQLGHTPTPTALMSEGVGGSGCKLLPKSPRAKT